MMRTNGWLRVALVTGLVTGCTGEDIDGDDLVVDAGADGKADEPGGSGTEIMTRADNVELLTGYHGLFDRVGSTCVEAQDAKRVVGAVSERFDMVYVSSREELARELGLDLKLKARYAGFEGDLGAEALRKFSGNSTTVNLLIKLEQGYAVAENSELALNATGQQALGQGTQQFADTCGANYISSINYSSSFMLLVSLECESTSVANQVKASLKLDTPKVVPVDGTLEGKLSNATTQQGVTLHVQAIADGFSPDQPVADLGKDGLTSEAFKVLNELRTSMKASRQKDMDYDTCMAGGSGCSGQRRARATGVKVGFYGDLPGVAQSDVFREIRDHWTEVETISATMSRSHERLEAAHAEARDFLGASEQGLFNVYEPGAPLTNTKALRELATAHKATLDPSDGSSAAGKLFNTLQSCWGRASDDVTYMCDDLEWEAQVESADALLAEYQGKARILPLDMMMVDASTAWWELWKTTDPHEACRKISPSGSYRVPRAHELPLVAPMVADGPIDWGSAAQYAIWYDDASACGSGERPYYTNDGSGEPTLGCSGDSDYITTVVCVPADGPQTPVQPI